jgi:hypothetical protein
MSTEDNEEYNWRETYHILFREADRPTLTQVERALGSLGHHIRLENVTADEEGRFESATIQSPDDYAALEIYYESGEAVVEQAAQLARQLKSEAEPAQLRRLVSANARLDVMHFEHIVGNAYDDEDVEEMLDPTCLLMVVEALVDLTRGVAIDPASGAILP